MLIRASAGLTRSSDCAYPVMDHECIMRSFPDLFPYTGAALGDGNGDSIDFFNGVKWLLAYKDGRFAQYQPLVNALFQCVTDRRLTRALEKLIRDHYRNLTYNIVSDITVDNILAVATEEDQNDEYSDDWFTWLAKNSLSICGAIPGTIWSRASVRNVVFSLVTKFGTSLILLSFMLATDNNLVINLVNGSSVDYNLMQEDKETVHYGPSSDVYGELTPPRVTRLACLVQQHNCNDCTGDSGRSCHQAHLRIPSMTDIVMENRTIQPWRANATYDNFNPILLDAWRAKQNIKLMSYCSLTGCELWDCATLLGSTTCPVNNADIINTMITDVASLPITHHYSDRFTRATHLLAVDAMTMTCLNEVSNELKIYNLMDGKTCEFLISSS
jgi:hypothetical protein